MQSLSSVSLRQSHAGQPRIKDKTLESIYTEPEPQQKSCKTLRITGIGHMSLCTPSASIRGVYPNIKSSLSEPAAHVHVPKQQAAPQVMHCVRESSAVQGSKQTSFSQQEQLPGPPLFWRHNILRTQQPENCMNGKEWKSWSSAIPLRNLEICNYPVLALSNCSAIGRCDT